VSPTALWCLVVALNAVCYVRVVVRRGEAGLVSSLLLVLLLGPFAWFVWFARRAGARHARQHPTVVPPDPHPTVRA
jgi:hypothetical protein